MNQKLDGKSGSVKEFVDIKLDRKILPYFRDYLLEIFKPFYKSKLKRCNYSVAAIRILYTFVKVYGNAFPVVQEPKVVAIVLGGKEFGHIMQTTYKMICSFFINDFEKIEGSNRLSFRIPINSAQDLFDLYLIAQRAYSENLPLYQNRIKFKVYNLHTEFNPESLKRIPDKREFDLDYRISYSPKKIDEVINNFRKNGATNSQLVTLINYQKSLSSSMLDFPSGTSLNEKTIQSPTEEATQSLVESSAVDLISNPENFQVLEILDELKREFNKKLSYLELKFNAQASRIRGLENYLKEYMILEKSKVLAKSRGLENLLIDETVKTPRPIQDDLIF